MATIFSHTHFCPMCNDTWKCVSWVCEEEDGHLACPSCRAKTCDECEPAQTIAKKRYPADSHDKSIRHVLECEMHRRKVASRLSSCQGAT